MSEKREPMYPSNNNGKNRSDEEIEETLEDEQEEKSGLSKILENKKITAPVLIILIVLGLIYVFSPSKEKEEVPNKKEKVQTAENINLDSLESKKTDENLQNPNYQSNGNSQEFFSYDDSNLQAYSPPENTPNLDIPKNTQSDYTYGNYPSYYGQDELPDDEYSLGNSKNQQSQKTSSTEKKQSKSISFERGNKQSSTPTQGADQTGTQQQAPSNQKKTFQLSSGLTAPTSPYEIKTGELIPAVLMSGIDSDLAGNITAIVSQDVYDSVKGKYLLIPKGSKIYGTYDSNILYGQNRLMLIWQRIILPNGYSINLESMQGIDITGQAGVKGKVNNHTLKLLRSIVLSSIFNFVSSGVSISAGKDIGKNADVSATATLGQNVANDTSSKLQSAGDMIIERDLNQQPTIKVKAGTRFSIMVNNDMVLVPYNKLRGNK